MVLETGPGSVGWNSTGAKNRDEIRRGRSLSQHQVHRRCRPEYQWVHAQSGEEGGSRILLPSGAIVGLTLGLLVGTALAPDDETEAEPKTGAEFAIRNGECQKWCFLFRLVESCKKYLLCPSTCPNQKSLCDCFIFCVHFGDGLAVLYSSSNNSGHFGPGTLARQAAKCWW
jgi:hypothetical protein